MELNTAAVWLMRTSYVVFGFIPSRRYLEIRCGKRRSSRIRSTEFCWFENDDNARQQHDQLMDAAAAGMER